MVRSNFGAVRLPLLGAAVLASFAVSLSAQVVEKGRTYADLVATHPCNSGNSGRLARVTDAQSSSSIGGGGGSTQVWAVCDGVSTWTLTSIGSAGGGAATAVTGSATLPATCTEKDLYQDTDSGGTEFYVCTATNTWTKAGTIGGSTGSTDNAVLSADGTGGVTLQTRAITISDVSGFIVTLASTPGNALSLVATAPAATTGASQAGKAASLTASAAVASTDTAGAAAGGNVTIAGGAAARFTSGDADGGNINLLPGSGIGTGASGVVGIGPSPSTIYKLDVNAGGGPYSARFLTSGSNIFRMAAGAGDNAVRFDSAVGSWLVGQGDGSFAGSADGDFMWFDYAIPRIAMVLRDTTGFLNLASVGQFAWGSGGAGTASDTGIARGAAGIVDITNGGTGAGALHLRPMASPPRTCDATAEGDLYSDTSHALCWCDATTWQKLSGAGTCA